MVSSSSAGWGEPYSQQKESSSWGEPSAGPPVTVDNGTSAWGKPMDTSAGWDEPNKDVRESGPGWGNQHKSGRWTAGFHLTYVPYLLFFVFLSLHLSSISAAPKPMETWGSEDVSMSNSWDQEEEVEIGMWTNNQQDNRSHDQNTWNYKQKGPNKVCRIKHTIIFF